MPRRAEKSHACPEPMLIETKLAPPQVSSHLLSIPRLEGTFDAAFSRRLACLIAPAGYGKTSTLIKQRAFVESRGVRTGWVNLDTEDNDPIRFLHYVVVALQRAMPHIGRYALAQMSPSSLPSVEALLLSICNDLGKVEGELALFVDDYHLIENEAVHGAMEWLVTRSPRNLKFFIASRTQLPLSLGKLRIANDIYEVRAEELSLDLEETAFFVNTVSERSLSAQQIRLLYERTEGWVVGIQLAALALKEVSDIAEFIDAFSGSDRDITAYLGEIVLSQLPSDVREFITHTALFDRFSAEFCRDALNRKGAVRLVDWVETHNLFLIPLDRQKKWYRYHHLFADYLKARFMLSHPDEARTIYRAGSAWFESHRLMSEAIRYAFAGNDYLRAADLIADFAYELVQLRGEHATLLNWITALPQAYIEQRPKIKLPTIWSLMLTHRYQEAEREFASLEKVIENKAALALPPEQQADLDFVTQKNAMMRCVLYGVTDRPVLAGQWSLNWLARWEHSGDPVDAGIVRNAFGYSAYIARDYERARQSFTASRIILEKSNSYYGVAWSETLHALAALEQGDIFDADRILVRGHKVVSEKLGPYSYGGSLIALVRAYVCYEQNRIDEAERILEAAFLFADIHGFVETSMAAYLSRTRILWLRGLREEADSCLADGVATADRMGLPRLALTLCAERIHLLLKSGLIERALRIARSVGYGDGDDNGKRRRDCAVDDISMRLVEIRLQLAANDTDRTSLLLNELMTEARRHGRNSLLIKLLLLKAVLQTRRGNRDEALRTTDEALALGASGGHCRIFVDEGPPTGELIREVLDRRSLLNSDSSGGAPRDYLIQVLSTFDGKPLQSQYTAPTKAVSLAKNDLFSERETQILKLVDNGLGNRELAAQLFLSEATVKWHLHNIYTKLGVCNRTSAIARARELALI